MTISVVLFRWLRRTNRNMFQTTTRDERHIADYELVNVNIITCAPLTDVGGDGKEGRSVAWRQYHQVLARPALQGKDAIAPPTIYFILHQEVPDMRRIFSVEKDIDVWCSSFILHFRQFVVLDSVELVRPFIVYEQMILVSERR